MCRCVSISPAETYAPLRSISFLPSYRPTPTIIPSETAMSHSSISPINTFTALQFLKTRSAFSLCVHCSICLSIFRLPAFSIFYLYLSCRFIFVATAFRRIQKNAKERFVHFALPVVLFFIFMVGYLRAFLMLQPFYHKKIFLSSLLAPCCAPFFVKRKPLAFIFSTFAGKLTSRGSRRSRHDAPHRAKSLLLSVVKQKRTSKHLSVLFDGALVTIIEY